MSLQVASNLGLSGRLRRLEGKVEAVEVQNKEEEVEEKEEECDVRRGIDQDELKYGGKKNPKDQ